jgi:4-alpha-glucanotransferase
LSVVPEAAASTEDLHVLAQYCGIAVSFVGGDDRLVEVDDPTLRALLAAFDIDTTSARATAEALERQRTAAATRVLPPVVAMTHGVTTELVVRVPSQLDVQLWVELEDGGRRHLDVAPGPAAPFESADQISPREVDLPADLPEGYHRLHVVAGSSPHTCRLVVAPAFLAFPASVTKPRVWGFAAQLYSTPSRQSWGIGDLADLRELLSWSGSRHGADYLLINPINSAAPVAPLEPSPYLPVSRRYFDPQYLRVEDIPEFEALPAAGRERCAELHRSAANGRNGPGLLDRDTAWTAKREALLLLHAASRSTTREAQFRAYVDREGEDLLRYATWCALAERHGPVSGSWAGGLRAPG